MCRASFAAGESLALAAHVLETRYGTRKRTSKCAYEHGARERCVRVQESRCGDRLGFILPSSHGQSEVGVLSLRLGDDSPRMAAHVLDTQCGTHFLHFAAFPARCLTRGCSRWTISSMRAWRSTPARNDLKLQRCVAFSCAPNSLLTAGPCCVRRVWACACVCARARARVCACVHASASLSGCVCVCVCGCGCECMNTITLKILPLPGSQCTTTET